MKLALFLLLILPILTQARHVRKLQSHHSKHHIQPQPMEKEWIGNQKVKRRGMIHKRSDTLEIAGSTLPDCSHACGSCTPCRLVMVSFVCSSLEEAETCPMAYKCMCRNKSYPIP